MEKMTIKKLIRAVMKVKLFCLLVVVLSASVGANDIALTMDDFWADPEIRDMDISPNGDYLALVWQDGDMRKLSVRDLTKPGYPVLATLGDDIVRPSWATWANDGRLLFSLLVPANTNRVRRESLSSDEFDVSDYAMYSRMAAVDWDGRNFTMLMGNINSIRYVRSLSRVAHFLPGENNHVLMEVYDHGRLKLYKVNVVTGEAIPFAKAGSRTVRIVLSREGEVEGRIDYLRLAKALQFYEYTDKGKWKKGERIYLKDKEKNDFDIDDFFGVYGDDFFVYKKENEETGYDELLLRKRGSDESSVLVSLDNQDVLGTLVERDGLVVGYTYEKDDVVRRHYFDEKFHSTYESIVSKVSEFGFNGVFLGSRTKKRDKFIVSTYGLNDPGSYLLYDKQKDAVEFLGFSYPNLSPEKLASPSLVSYKARDGLRIRAYLLRPPGFDKQKPLPTIILPHGGPQSRDYAYYDRFAQFLSTRGYAVLQPNFRGSIGYGKAFEKAGYKQWGGTMQDDLEDGVNYLVKKGITDPNRVCIVGGSYGGYAALMGVIKTPDLYVCAVSLNGVTHLPDQIKYGFKRFKDIERLKVFVTESIGDLETDMELLAINSPVLHVDKIKVPVFLSAGTRDEVVPYKQTKSMVRALKKAGKEYTFIKLKDTGHHIFSYEKDVDKLYPAIEKFLAEYLQVEAVQ